MTPSNPTEPKMLSEPAPFAWIVRAENGNTILWSTNRERAQDAAAKYDRPLEALYLEAPRSSHSIRPGLTGRASTPTGGSPPKEEDMSEQTWADDRLIKEMEYANAQRNIAAGLFAAMREACDLLAERTYGSSARSPGHNARLVLEAAMRAAQHTPFQARVQSWMVECFTPEIALDRVERSDRFIEEALELVQAQGYSAERAHALVDYVFGRPVGEPDQEVGGAMVTLAALCGAAGLDMHAAAERELARINQPAVMDKIRAKQAAKPTGSALPTAPAALEHPLPEAQTDAG